MVDDFFNLVHFWPVTIKKDKNVSHNMYRVFTGNKAKDHETSLDLHKQINNNESQSTYWLIELLAKKIEERFHRVADAYVYFSTYAASLRNEQRNAEEAQSSKITL